MTQPTVSNVMIQAYCRQCNIIIHNVTASVRECPFCKGPTESPLPTVSSLQGIELEAEDLSQRWNLAIRRTIYLEETIDAANTRIAELEQTISARESMLDRLTASNDSQLRMIGELEQLNAFLLSERGCAPGAANVISGALAKRDEWKIRAEELESQVSALQWKEITPESLPSLNDEVGGWMVYPNEPPYWDIHTALDAHIDIVIELMIKEDWDELEYTHYRPLATPPSPSRVLEVEP